MPLPSFFSLTRLGCIVACVLIITGCTSGDDGPTPTRIPPIDLGNNPPTAVLPDAPPTPLPPTWTPKPTLTDVPLVTAERTPRPTTTPYIIPTRTRPPEVEAQVRQLSDLPVITAKNAARLSQVAQLEQQVKDFAFSPDGTRLALAVNYEGLWIYNPAALDYPLRRMGTSWYWPRDVSYHPDELQVAVAYDDGQVRVWNPETGGVVRVIDAFSGDVWAVSYSSDGRILAAGGNNGRIKLWDSASGSLLCELNGSSSDVYRLVFQPAGTLLLAGGDEDYIWVWDTTSCTQRAVLEGGGYGNALVFSPDGKTFASGGGSFNNVINLWNSLSLEDDQPLAQLETGFGYAVGLAFSPDGSLLAAATSEDELRVWDVATRQQVAQISTRLFWVDALRFSPDSRLILLAGEYSDMVFFGVTSGG
jgi:WD40 repeat protein